MYTMVKSLAASVNRITVSGNQRCAVFIELQLRQIPMQPRCTRALPLVGRGGQGLVWFSMQICSIEFHSFDSCVAWWQNVYAMYRETKSSRISWVRLLHLSPQKLLIGNLHWIIGRYELCEPV